MCQNHSTHSTVECFNLNFDVNPLFKCQHSRIRIISIFKAVNVLFNRKIDKIQADILSREKERKKSHQIPGSKSEFMLRLYTYISWSDCSRDTLTRLNAHTIYASWISILIWTFAKCRTSKIWKKNCTQKS